jgi:hypothetical protein
LASPMPRLLWVHFDGDHLYRFDLGTKFTMLLYLYALFLWGDLSCLLKRLSIYHISYTIQMLGSLMLATS